MLNPSFLSLASSVFLFKRKQFKIWLISCSYQGLGDGQWLFRPLDLTFVVVATQQLLSHNLVPAFLGGDPAYLPTFLGTYRAFGTTQQVLDLLHKVSTSPPPMGTRGDLATLQL